MDLADFIDVIVQGENRGCTTVMLYCRQCGGLINNMGIRWAFDNLDKSLNWGSHCAHCNHKLINWDVHVKVTDLFGNEI